MDEKEETITDNPTKTPLSNVCDSKKVSSSDISDQSTLLLDDDFWKKLALFFRSEVSLILQQHEQQYHNRPHSGISKKCGKDNRRPRKDWRLLCSIAVKIIEKDGYLYVGNLKEDRKLAIAFPTSQQFSYLIKNLLMRYPDLVTFHLDCNNWKIVSYHDERDRIKNMLEKKFKKAKKPKHWV